MAIKAKKLTADDVEAFLLAEGFREVTKEELLTPEWREEVRANLRILAYDDTSIPAPDEEKELDTRCGPVSMQLPGGITRPVQES